MVEGVVTAKIVSFRKGSMELRMREKRASSCQCCTHGAVYWLLGPHNILLCVLIMVWCAGLLSCTAHYSVF